jgi:hypothetical protein
MQWGEKYRDLHRAAWAEAVRVLRHGGTFLLNVKDHQRNKRRVPVVDWHAEVLANLGMKEGHQYDVGAPGYRRGANAEARYPEVIVRMVRP